MNKTFGTYICPRCEMKTPLTFDFVCCLFPFSEKLGKCGCGLEWLSDYGLGFLGLEKDELEIEVFFDLKKNKTSIKIANNNDLYIDELSWDITYDRIQKLLIMR